MTAAHYDVAIIGAGIVGTACAFELSREKLSVCIVDERGVGTGATAAGMGHLVVLDDSDAQFELTRYSLALWNNLADQLPAPCEFWRCGTVWVAEDEEELRFAERRVEYFCRGGVAAQLLNSSDLARLEPNLRSGLPGGVMIAGDASLVPSATARFFMDSGIREGAELIAKRAVELTDNRIVLNDGSQVSAGIYINATGTAAATLLRNLPVRSRKGHILVVQAPPGFARHQVMELGYLKSAHATEEHDSVAFAVRQKTNGELLIGSSRQYGVEDAQVEPEILERMRNRALAFMPALSSAPDVTSWTGFRAGTPDGLPLIGLCPRYRRVYAATGHEGLGVTTSVVTARLLADSILDRPSEIPAQLFSPARFAAQRS